MQFTFLSLANLATLISAVSAICPEAARFGAVSVSPSTGVLAGVTITVRANLTCAVQLGYTPTFLDYYIDGTAPHAISGPIQLARRTYDATSPPVDEFTAVVPNWFYFADATYSVRMDNSFAKPGPTGESVITVGSISTPIAIEN
ncbi:hypothetical protein C8R46DRAFT_1107690 [Mycena filopes]|nr:hypothetical protein C8R46DRAFT_1107690 [Mycena filopes]